MTESPPDSGLTASKRRRRRGKFVRLVLAGIFTLAVGAALTHWVLQPVFGIESKYRYEHGLVACCSLVAAGFFFRPRGKAWLFVLAALLPCYLGSAFPDLDIKLLGIGGHRNPLFHSALAYIPAAALMGRLRVGWAWAAAGFGIGLGSHLLWDVVEFNDVRWFPGSSFDKLWLIGNGVFAVIHPMIALRRRHRALKRARRTESFGKSPVRDP